MINYSLNIFILKKKHKKIYFNIFQNKIKIWKEEQ